MATPLVSIIIPVYNVEQYIEKTLASVVNQSFDNIEIICVNDGSTDSSWEKIKVFASKDKRIALVNYSENHGLSFVRNRGLENAKGKYVMFLDSDDSLVQDAVEIAYQQIEEKCLDLLMFGFQYEYASDEVRNNYYIPEDDLSLFENKIYTGYEFVALCEQNRWPTVTSCNVIYKRKFLTENKLSFIEGIIHEDEAFINDCIFRAEKMSVLNKKLYKYYRRPDSITTINNIKDAANSNFLIFIHLVKLFLEKNCPREFHSCMGRHIAKYCMNAYRTYRKACNCLSLKRIDFGDDKYEKAFAIFSALQIGTTKWKITAEELKKVTVGEKIILYGAGEIGRNAINYLSSMNINEFIVAVTKARENEYLAGNKVYSISDLEIQNKAEVVVLLALSRKSHKEIIEKLKLLGYTNIISMV